MNDALLLTAAAAATVLATGLGAIPVMLLGDRATVFEPALSGLAIGVMAVAAIVGLLVPAVQDGGPVEVLAGVVIGAGGLWWAGHRLRARFVTEERQGRADRLAVLTFGVLLVHSLPEGLAIGAAWEASGGLATFVILAIAIQNIPEGTAVAVALEQAGRGPWEQFRAAVLSSAPQVPGALLAWWAVDAINGLLPVSFAAAGAAMLALVGAELIPAAWRAGGRRSAAGGALAGALIMGLIAVLLSPAA